MADPTHAHTRLGPIRIGPYLIDKPVFLAPMAGVTDAPFRRLCLRYGAGLATAEMLTSDVDIWDSTKSTQRRVRPDEPEPRSVQIVGNDPCAMAHAARSACEQGAQIIDINLGCPAKKVCKRAAGSALLREPALVEQILRSVVNAVDVPVTMKIRTGWCPETRNGVDIARMAEDVGIQLIAVHGRTRACRFKGDAEYDTIAAIKNQVSIPVIANGDIDSAEKAEQVFLHTGVDGVMIGRAAQGRPWLLRQIGARLTGKPAPEAPSVGEVQQVIIEHLTSLHAHYGHTSGTRIARKHIGWYLHNQTDSVIFRQQFNRLDSAEQQLDLLNEYFSGSWRPEQRAA